MVGMIRWHEISKARLTRLMPLEPNVESGASIDVKEEETVMGTFTIRHLDERTHAWLRRRAQSHGRSVEAEVSAILDAAVGLPTQNILLALHATMSEAGGIDLRVPARGDQSRPVDLA